MTKLGLHDLACVPILLAEFALHKSELHFVTLIKYKS
jgi:hypothetical protein